MTVEELIAALAAAFPRAFTDDAIATWGPVYRKVAGSHQGAALSAAWVNCLASFKPKHTEPFPLPAKVAEFLPGSMHQALKGDGGQTVDPKAHREKRDALVARWWERQGTKILAARGSRVANACAAAITQGFLRHDPAGKGRPVAVSLHMRAFAPEPELATLTADEIQSVEDALASQRRIGIYGVRSLGQEGGDVWAAEMAECRRAVRAGERMPASRATSEQGYQPSAGMAQRLGALARAARENRA